MDNSGNYSTIAWNSHTSIQSQYSTTVESTLMYCIWGTFPFFFLYNDIFLLESHIYVVMPTNWRTVLRCAYFWPWPHSNHFSHESHHKDQTKDGSLSHWSFVGVKDIYSVYVPIKGIPMLFGTSTLSQKTEPMPIHSLKNWRYGTS